VFDVLRRRVARMIAPRIQRVLSRMYAGARQSRLTSGWYATNSSADSELALSLVMLRNRSRALTRDAAYAKRAKTVVINNVIGTGIGMQAQVANQRGRLMDKINSDIEEAWCEWARAENCHTGGRLHFTDIERQAFGQIFEAGEILIRVHLQAFGNSKIPLALELIEPERLAEQMMAPQGMLEPGTYVRMGVEIDSFGRPVGYWVREQHPGDIQLIHPQADRVFRVPAEFMFHLFPINRWPQTRGEPWMHAVARRLNDMDAYSEAEITAARGAANYMAVVESPEDPTPDDVTDGQSQMELEPGLIQYLRSGEKLNMVSPNRPNPNMDPFMRMMLREVAAGIGVSYESISRDASQSNYSSSRMMLLEDRDLYRELQQWFIRAFREPLHRRWLQQAVLAGQVPSVTVAQYVADRKKFEAVAFKPRGWSWVDPTKEVDAYKEAVRCGFATVGDVVAATSGGIDLETMLTKRRAELNRMAELDLVFDTDPTVPAPNPMAKTEPAAAPLDDESAATKPEDKLSPVDGRVVNLGAKRV
jgi:lambda family phage portal protein